MPGSYPIPDPKKPYVFYCPETDQWENYASMTEASARAKRNVAEHRHFVFLLVESYNADQT